MLLLLQAPARDVELVRPLVAAVSVAVIPMPMPVVVEPVTVERPLRGRAQPQVVVDFRQVLICVGGLVGVRGERERVLLARLHRAVRIFADRRPRLVAESARHVDVAEAAFVDELDRLAYRRPGSVHADYLT